MDPTYAEIIKVASGGIVGIILTETYRWLNGRSTHHDVIASLKATNTELEKRNTALESELSKTKQLLSDLQSKNLNTKGHIVIGVL